MSNHREGTPKDDGSPVCALITGCCCALFTIATLVFILVICYLIYTEVKDITNIVVRDSDDFMGLAVRIGTIIKANEANQRAFLDFHTVATCSKRLELSDIPYLTLTGINTANKLTFEVERGTTIKRGAFVKPCFCDVGDVVTSNTLHNRDFHVEAIKGSHVITNDPMPWLKTVKCPAGAKLFLVPSQPRIPIIEPLRVPVHDDSEPDGGDLGGICSFFIEAIGSYLEHPTVKSIEDALQRVESGERERACSAAMAAAQTNAARLETMNNIALLPCTLISMLDPRAVSIVTIKNLKSTLCP